MSPAGDLDAADEAHNEAASLAEERADDETLVNVRSAIAWAARSRRTRPRD
jgi:hypothetical protein